MTREELEKENEQLKEKNNQLTRKCECLTKCNDGLQDLLSNDIDTLEQLIEAKEIIKNLMYTPRECIPWYVLCDKAKQFLKEIKKDDAE